MYIYISCYILLLWRNKPNKKKTIKNKKNKKLWGQNKGNSLN